MNATTINDLVAMVRERVDPAGLIARDALEQYVREERTEPYEAHGDGDERAALALDALCDRVFDRIHADERQPGDYQIVFTMNVRLFHGEHASTVGADITRDDADLAFGLRLQTREMDGRRAFACEQAEDGLARMLASALRDPRWSVHSYGDPRIEVHAANLTDNDLNPEDDR